MSKIKSRKLGMKKKGFSLMEAVISVFVVAVGLVAAINLMVSGINHSTDSRDHVVASQLAQEGVELVRNLRDNNWAVGNVSFDIAKFPAVSKSNCRIDKDSNNIHSCAPGADHKKLNYDGNNFYVHAAGTATKFQRKIELDFDNPSLGDLTVTSIVIWGSGFPAVLADCNVSNECVSTQSVLTEWGE